MTYCDFEAPEFYTEKLCISRKEYKCCETHEPIRKGEAYWRIVAKWEGTIETMRQCQWAYKFARKINGADPYDPKLNEDGCIPFGGIEEEIAQRKADFREDDFTREWDEHMAMVNGK